MATERVPSQCRPSDLATRSTSGCCRASDGLLFRRDVRGSLRERVIDGTGGRFAVLALDGEYHVTQEHASVFLKGIRTSCALLSRRIGISVEAAVSCSD